MVACFVCALLPYSSMCGFVGWVDQNPAPISVLQTMADALIHRGPDAQGIYAKGPLGLAHLRLSILDLEGSFQPMWSQDKRYVLVYNGELYNFRELRLELEKEGVNFHSQGDTEVVLQALILWKEKALTRFSGMFGFAFWDAVEEELLLARDHLGVKPLYFSLDAEKILFASELKAFRYHPKFSQEIDPNAIGLYLECQYIPAPHTIYKQAQKLLPAHFLLYKNKKATIERYWVPSYCPKWEYDEETALEMLGNELSRSVRSMLVSDVPIGAFVSGGIDSSLIAAIMQKESNKKIDMFSIALKHTHGEQEHAQKVANFLGANFHPFVVEPKDILDVFTHSMDEPFGDQALLPTLLLSKWTRNSVKVVLTGEGADEVLAGYSNYAKRMGDLPLCNRLHQTILPYLYPWFPSKLKKSRICKAMARPISRRYATIPHIFCRESYKSLLQKPFLSTHTLSLETIAEKYYDECDSSQYLDKMLHIDTRLWLPDDLLTKVDLATMAYSLEARVPYLDHRFVEFAARLPAHYKLRGQVGKYLLKKWAGQGMIPQDIASRPKWGFVMPLGDWMQKELKPLVKDSLLEGGLMKRNIFRSNVLRDLYSAPKKSDAARLYSLLALESWFCKHHPNYRF